MDKTLIGVYFTCLVVHTKELLELVRTVRTHTRYEGDFLVSLSQVFYEISNEPEQTQGTKSHSYRARHMKIFEI